MHVVHLAEALDPTRFRTRLITGRITEDEGDMTYYARERGVEVTEIAGMSRLLSPLRDLRSFLTLLRIFRRERPKIVHTHTAKAGTVARLAAMAAGVPVIIHTFHGHVLGGLYFSRLKTRFFLAIERRLARATDRLIVLTHAQAREMAEGLRVAPMDRFAVIPLGLNLQPFADVDRAAARSRVRAELGIGEDSPVVGIVGRMVPVKNHPLLFDAMARLKGRMDPVPHLIVVGSGERERALRAYVSDKGSRRCRALARLEEGPSAGISCIRRDGAHLVRRGYAGLVDRVLGEWHTRGFTRGRGCAGDPRGGRAGAPCGIRFGQ